MPLPSARPPHATRSGAVRGAAALGLLLALPALAPAQQRPAPSAQQAALIKAIDGRADHYADVAKQIWGFAEVGYQEVKSSALLQAELKAAGFAIKTGVAGEPTAFTAEFGSGKPVIAILGEFDALPGLSQDVTAERKPIVEGAPGHGCGHNLFGTASTAAAIAVKDWMVQKGIKGTLRFYGTPAEEGGSGKVYMVRDGLFDDVDAAVVWHPGDRNNVDLSVSQANITGKFRFHGISAHAAAAPERGRSALDAVEVMDVMVNFMREHVPQDTRIHYVITNGGKAPNVVPDFAEVYYYARQKDMTVLRDVWDRIVNAAKGAALGTGTTYDLVITGSVYPMMPNETLAKLGHRNMEVVGGYALNAEEAALGAQLQKTFPQSAIPLETTQQVRPLQAGETPASTDVSDVSWVVPTVQFGAATWVPGTAAHSWQAVVASGNSIGTKGMLVAAKSMALTAADLFQQPQTLAAARAELVAKRGKDFVYTTYVGKQAPALDYRK